MYCYGNVAAKKTTDGGGAAEGGIRRAAVRNARVALVVPFCRAARQRGGSVGKRGACAGEPSAPSQPCAHACRGTV